MRCFCVITCSLRMILQPPPNTLTTKSDAVQPRPSLNPKVPIGATLKEFKRPITTMAFENSRNGIPEGTKFRSSCDACSAAKIKCTQERPECSHCAKRLRVCVYSLSKRVKRPRRPQMRHEGRGNPGSGTGQAVAPGDETIPGSAPLDSAGSSIDCMTSIDFLSSAASHPVTPRPSDWYDFFSHSDLTTTTNLFVEAASSTDWASLVATAEPFATLLDPALDFPASLPVPDPDHVQSVEKSNSDSLENINDTSIGSRGSLTNSPSRSCEVVSSETSSFPDINHPNNAKRAPPEGDS